MEVEAAKLIAAAIAMGVGSIGAAIGEGMVGAKALEAMSRNPSMSDKIMTNMLVAMAVTESTAIYSLVISLIILFGM